MNGIINPKGRRDLNETSRDMTPPYYGDTDRYEEDRQERLRRKKKKLSNLNVTSKRKSRHKFSSLIKFILELRDVGLTKKEIEKRSRIRYNNLSIIDIEKECSRILGK